MMCARRLWKTASPSLPNTIRTPEEYKEHAGLTLETQPDLIIDDGGDLVAILHGERPDLLAQLRGGARRRRRASCG